MWIGKIFFETYERFELAEYNKKVGSLFGCRRLLEVAEIIKIRFVIIIIQYKWESEPTNYKNQAAALSQQALLI